MRFSILTHSKKQRFLKHQQKNLFGEHVFRALRKHVKMMGPRLMLHCCTSLTLALTQPACGLYILVKDRGSKSILPIPSLCRRWNAVQSLSFFLITCWPSKSEKNRLDYFLPRATGNRFWLVNLKDSYSSGMHLEIYTSELPRIMFSDYWQTSILVWVLVPRKEGIQ